MQQHEVPLEIGQFYHIYNRGINGETIFLQEKNYPFFLERYAHFMFPVVETYAYCLLRNHFHLLIRVRDELEINEFVNGREIKLSQQDKGLHSINHIVSKQFARLFSSYSQSFNKVYSRTGSLIETPFKRKWVASEEYFTTLVFYIHHNPQKHGFVKDFRNYPYSSYQSHLSMSPTKLERAKVLSWFGNQHEYKLFHHKPKDVSPLKELLIELD